MARNVFDMAFAKVYPCLIAKAEKKGRNRDEVLLVTSWMTGYRAEQLEELAKGWTIEKITGKRI